MGSKKMPDIKKEKEKYYLEKMLCNLGNHSLYEIIYSEKPDFLLRKGNENYIGIELTGLFQEPKKLQVEEQSKILDLARHEAIERKISPLIVDVYFRDDGDLRKNKRREIAERLTEIIESNVPEIDSSVHVECDYSTGERWPTQLLAISVYRPKVLKSHLWQSSLGGIVNENFVERLQDSLDLKDIALKKYSEKCQEFWLLVYAEGRDGSSSYEMSKRMAEHKYKSKFDQVYFLSNYPETVTKLKIGA